MYILIPLAATLLASSSSGPISSVPFTTQTGYHYFSQVAPGHLGAQGSPDHASWTLHWWTDAECKSIEVTPRFDVFITARKVPNGAETGPKTLYARVKIELLLSGPAGSVGKLTTEPQGAKVLSTGAPRAVDMQVKQARLSPIGAALAPFSTVTLPIRMVTGEARVAATKEKYQAVWGDVDLQLGRLSLSNGASAQIRFTVLSITDAPPADPKPAP